MTSWKSRIFCSLVKQEIDKVEEILNEENIASSEHIVIRYAEDCNTCVGNLEYPMNPVQHNIDAVLNELKPMIDAGLCGCHGPDVESDGMGIIQSVSVLHLACVYGPVRLVRRLLGDGSCDAREESLAAGFTALHYVAQSDSVSSDDVSEITALLLATQNVDVNARDKRRNIPLHLALENHHTTLALCLIDHHSLLDTENDTGETPLLIAAKMADVDVLVELCERGANPNIRDKNDMLALNIAIHKRSLTMIRAILDNTRVNTNLIGVARHGYRPMSPIVYATCRENDEAVELLLKKGAFVDCVDTEDNQPLLIASYANNLNIAEILIRYGANVNLAPRQGYSPLHHAAWEGHTAMCRILLQSGAHNDTQTRDKNTPLALACHGDSVDTIALLLSRHCDVNNQDKDLDAPVHYCTYNGNHEAVAMLLDRGADPDIVNVLNVTPLWNAVYADCLPIVELLIAANVRLDVASQGIDQHAETDHPTLIYQTPRTPLYVACSRTDMRIPERIVLAGADFTDEKWYWAGDFPQELRDNAQLLHWITHQATTPPSLVRLTRTAIRKNLLRHHPQSTVQKLEIPKVLKEFLLIKSFAVDL